MKAMIAVGIGGSPTGLQEVTAYKTNTPGLIVTDAGWNVTHEKSGMKVAGPFYNKQHAIDWANNDQDNVKWDNINPEYGS